MRKIFLSLIVCILSVSLFGQSVAFLNINTDARSLGLAGSAVALDGSAFAADNNIASLGSGVGVSYTMWQPKVAGSSIISAGAGYTFGKLSIGLDFKNFSQKEIAVTSSNGQNKGLFKPSDMAIGLGAAYHLDNLSFGLNAKFVNSKLGADFKASAVAFDLGVRYSKDALSAGIAVNNLGGKVKYDETPYALPSILKAGAAYKLSDLLLSAQFDMCFKSGMGFSLGAEYGFKDMLFARAGYRYGNGINALPSFASVGLGAKFVGINIDITYLLASPGLANTLMFGLGYSF